MKDLTAVSEQEQNDFFKSFDYVLCDVDGVIWLSNETIPGASSAINCLKELKKTVTFVSNNNTKSHEIYYNQLKSIGIKLNKDDLIQPVLAMISYLRSINFSKEIYLIGMTPMREELEKAGFKIAEYDPDVEVTSVQRYIQLSLDISPDVGAVIVDIDVNMRMYQLQRAVTYLQKPDVLFITGGSDTKLIFGGDKITIGPGYFHKIIEDMTGRKPLCIAKPGLGLRDFINEKLNIVDPSRVLFIGDSISEDMGFASKCGYKKLLVLSGLAKRNSLNDWAFPEEFKPDYYVDSLKNIQDLIESQTK